MPDTADMSVEPTRPSDQPSRTGRHLFALSIKIAIAAALLYWLVQSNRLDLRALSHIEDVPHAGVLITLAALGVFLGQLLLALRLLLLLKVVDVNVSYARVVGITLVGSFFGCVLPGLVGGDVVKAVYLCSDAVGRRANAVGAVIADRALGFYSLFLLGAVAWVMAWYTGSIPGDDRVFWAAPGAALAITVGLVLIGLPGYQTWRLSAVIWSRIPSKLQNLLRTLHCCLSRPGLLTVAVVLSLANHALVVATYLAAAVLLGDTVPLPVQFVLSPLAMAMNLVAVTPGGIGLTEGAFSFLYQSAGSLNGATIGLLGRIVQYISFAVAGLIALLRVRLRIRSSQ
jgi:glycosyltransferase 2 family protein